MTLTNTSLKKHVSIHIEPSSSPPSSSLDSSGYCEKTLGVDLDHGNLSIVECGHLLTEIIIWGILTESPHNNTSCLLLLVSDNGQKWEEKRCRIEHAVYPNKKKTYYPDPDIWNLKRMNLDPSKRRWLLETTYGFRVPFVPFGGGEVETLLLIGCCKRMYTCRFLRTLTGFSRFRQENSFACSCTGFNHALFHE